MDRIVVMVIIIFGLLLFAGVNASGMLGALALLYIIANAFRLILTRKFPKHFLTRIIAIAIGPFLLSYLLHSLFGQIKINISSPVSGLIVTLVILILMTISFFYVRRQIRRLQHTEHQGHTNERQPQIPVHHDEEEL